MAIGAWITVTAHDGFCPSCGGDGYTVETVGPYESKPVTCAACDGSRIQRCDCCEGYRTAAYSIVSRRPESVGPQQTLVCALQAVAVLADELCWTGLGTTMSGVPPLVERAARALAEMDGAAE
jgi:DnaJ-class molecular chaperone